MSDEGRVIPRANKARSQAVARRSPNHTQKDINKGGVDKVTAISSLLAQRLRSTHRTLLWALARVATLALRREVKHPERVRWHRFGYRHAMRVREGVAHGYSPASANLMLSCWRSVLKECWRLGLMGREEYERAADVQWIRADPLPRGRVLSPAEVGRLFDAAAADVTATGRRDALILALGIYGGLRREEMARLDVGDVDAVTGSVRVSGKGRRERMVTVTRAHAHLIAEWLAVRGGSPGALLWVAEAGSIHRLCRGRRLTGGSVWWVVSRLAASAGVSLTTPHDLRRTCATHLRRRGLDIERVGTYLGHSKLDTTRIYIRDDDALAALVEDAWR